ncbi:hypothetical protein chiPu_0033796, partial [Chiloscyllium punctatum]|nr:hypothetical protein [Chiloscyllium punctatum]
PDESSGEAGREEQTTKGHQAPIPGLDTRRADPVIPNLRGFLVRRNRLRCAAIMNGRSFEHVDLDVREIGRE